MLAKIKTGKTSMRVFSFIHCALFPKKEHTVDPYSLILGNFFTFYQYKTRTTSLFEMAKLAKMRLFQK
jgi:hypothetical protein